MKKMIASSGPMQPLAADTAERRKGGDPFFVALKNRARRWVRGLLLGSGEDVLQALSQAVDNLTAKLAESRKEIIDLVGYTHHDLHGRINDAARVREIYYRDLMMVLDRTSGFVPQPDFELQTDHPVAFASHDHQFPWGTKNDNTRSPRFVRACESAFATPIQYMDLGCSGGGLVLDFILCGHRAVGIDGSDYSLKAQRAEWRLLRNSLFTADIAYPFTILERATGRPMACDVISAWEVLEHLSEEQLPRLFENVARHLKPGGLFVGSVTTAPDGDPELGIVYHLSVQPRPWWEAIFRRCGFTNSETNPFQHADFCRLTGNGPMDPDNRTNPEIGFHFVLRKADG
jgi:SAM-dependent methyltransferase